MLIDEKIQEIQNLTKRKITYAEIAKIFGLTRSAVQNWALREKHLEEYQIKKIDETFLKQNETFKNQDANIINISYWEEFPEKLRISDFNCVTAEKNVIKNHWYLNPDNLRIITMVGDKMTNYWYPIRNNDILIIDTSQNYIMGNGVYFATSRNNSRFWIREMQALINDDVQIKGYAPSGDSTKVFTQAQLNEVDFKLIGKVIKNVSFRL